VCVCVCVCVCEREREREREGVSVCAYTEQCLLLKKTISHILSRNSDIEFQTNQSNQ
jgi:hypothetical protein